MRHKTLSMTPSKSPYCFLIQKLQILVLSSLVNEYLFSKKYFPRGVFMKVLLILLSDSLWNYK